MVVGIVVVRVIGVVELWVVQIVCTSSRGRGLAQILLAFLPQLGFDNIIREQCPLKNSYHKPGEKIVCLIKYYKMFFLCKFYKRIAYHTKDYVKARLIPDRHKMSG